MPLLQTLRAPPRKGSPAALTLTDLQAMAKHWVFSVDSVTPCVKVIAFGKHTPGLAQAQQMSEQTTPQGSPPAVAGFLPAAASMSSPAALVAASTAALFFCRKSAPQPPADAAGAADALLTLASPLFLPPALSSSSFSTAALAADRAACYITKHMLWV